MHFAVLLLAVALAGCGRKATPGEQAAASQALYLAPPEVTSVTRQGDTLTVSGHATAGARVRLATPAGAASELTADDKGRWTLVMPAAAEPRIYGLSMTGAGRQVQGQGYLLTAPGGVAALLRAGAGAIRLDPQPTAQIGAVDFDRDGEAVVSGSAPIDAALSVQVDGRQALDGRADDAGRYSLALPKELAAGAHRIEVLGDGFDSVVTVEIAGPQPLVGGPLRSQLTTGGVRIDWLTPGGGVQSTLLTG
jgi:hypothetical protein